MIPKRNNDFSGTEGMLFEIVSNGETHKDLPFEPKLVKHFSKEEVDWTLLLSNWRTSAKR